jgi:integrase/recombinase XerD
MTMARDEFVTMLETYLKRLQLRNIVPTTICEKEYLLKDFFCFCLDCGVQRPSEVTAELIARYQIVALKGKDGRLLSPKTVNKRLGTVALFFRFLFKNDYILSNPAAKIEYLKVPKKLPHPVLTHSEVEQILQLPDITKPLGVRDRAILETLYSTGIRRHEVCQLLVDDVDPKAGFVYVRHGKGGKSRMVPIGQRAIAWLVKYLSQVRPILLKDTDQATLFLTWKGKPFNEESLGLQISVYVQSVGIKGGCHVFRHTMATAMLENGADIRYIQEILGHEQIATTEIYTKVSIEKLKQVHRQTHRTGEESAVNMNSPILQTDKISKRGHPDNLINLSQSIRHNQWEDESQLLLLARKYLFFMEVKGFADVTIRKTDQYLRWFITWCHERSLKEALQVTKEVILHYQSYLSQKTKDDRPLSPAYCHNQMGALVRFFDYLLQKQVIAYNPLSTLELPKRKRQLPYNILNAQEAACILSQPNVKEPIGLRDRAILETLYSTGMRRQELVSLRLSDLHCAKATVHIKNGKGNKERIIPIGQGALAWVEKYLSEVRPLLLSEESQDFLFLGRCGRPIHPDLLGHVVNDYIKKSGIKKRGSCHIFRHSMATTMLENGADIRFIQQMLGHESMSSTQIYTKVSLRKLKEIHEQTHPARLKPKNCQNSGQTTVPPQEQSDCNT